MFTKKSVGRGFQAQQKGSWRRSPFLYECVTPQAQDLITGGLDIPLSPLRPRNVIFVCLKDFLY